MRWSPGMWLAAFLIAGGTGLGVALGDVFPSFHEQAPWAGGLAALAVVTALTVVHLRVLALPSLVALWLCGGAAVAIPETERPAAPARSIMVQRALCQVKSSAGAGMTIPARSAA